MVRNRHKPEPLTKVQIQEKLMHLKDEQVMSVQALEVRVDILKEIGCPDSWIVLHLEDLLQDTKLPKPPHQVRQYMRQIMMVLSTPLPPPRQK